MIRLTRQANVGVVGYTADMACESLRGRMEDRVRYLVVWHTRDRAETVRVGMAEGATAPPSLEKRSPWDLK